MKALTLLSARVAEMSAAEVAAAVGAEALAAVRREDDRPMFVELIAAHEGVSTGALAGSGRPAIKIWSRERGSELAARLAPGVPVFAGHGGTGRRPVGRMLAAAGRMISGALAAAGVAWISDPAAKARLRSGELDTCSIEAEVELHRVPGDEHWVVGAVRRVTGVALGDRRRERPGFAGATVLRVIEEFEGEGEGEPPASAPAAPPPPPDTDPAPASPPAGDDHSQRPRGVLAAELLAIRAELKELREELRRRDESGRRHDPRRPADPRRPDETRPRLSVPPERERPTANPLIPR